MVIIPVIMVLIMVIIMVIIMLNNFCFHVNAQKCQVVRMSSCQAWFLGTRDMLKIFLFYKSFSYNDVHLAPPHWTNQPGSINWPGTDQADQQQGPDNGLTQGSWLQKTRSDRPFPRFHPSSSESFLRPAEKVSHPPDHRRCPASGQGPSPRE